MHPQRQSPVASLAGHLGLCKLSVGQNLFENHRLGIALPQLYLNSKTFKRNSSRLCISTRSPTNTVVTVQETLDEAMSIAIDGFWGRTDTRRLRITSVCIALPELYLKDTPYCNRVFFFQNKYTFQLDQFTREPCGHCARAARLRRDPDAIDGFSGCGRTETQPNSFR